MYKISKILAFVLTLLWSLAGQAKNYYISPTGNDSNAGTESSPLATIQRAPQLAASGDIVYLHGGTYTKFSISSSDANYNNVNTLNKSGITYVAYSGETPVFNFSSIAASKRVCAFLVTGSNNTFQGFEVTGIQVGSQKQSECFRIDAGSGNKLLLLKIHDCPAIGVYIQKTASNTLVENCDSYNLVGSGNSAGNIDGFGSHSSGSGNTFRGCRAWNCSDDGYDCIKAAGAVTFEHCWAYKNGVNGGNGNGFKIGGWADSSPPATVPVHTVRFCLAANNSSHGFYANHQPGQAANWYNNTSYSNNSGNYNMLERVSRTDATDIAGTREVMHNNIAYAGTSVKNLNESGNIVSYNSWTKSVTINNSDFVSVDATQMTRVRQSNGSLPDITFMHLTANSDLINAGLNVGLSYNGSAPDLGCFETTNGSRMSISPINSQSSPETVDELSEVTVFPNPSNSHFTINTPGTFKYLITDTRGVEVEKGNGKESVSAGQSINSGWYVIRIQTERGRKSIKVLKSKN